VVGRRLRHPQLGVLDSGTHFKNSLLALLTKTLRCSQDIIVAYSPWINGSVERVNRDILQLVRVMLLELKLPPTELIYLVPLIQQNINHTPTRSLGGHAPVEVMTGLGYSHPVKTVLVLNIEPPLQIPWTNEKLHQHMSRTLENLQRMHKEVHDKREAQLLLNKKRTRGEHVVNFDIGDFVLRSRVDHVQGNKLTVMWVGPYQVMSATRHNAFEVQHVVTGKTVKVHASRLKYYDDASLQMREDLIDHVASQGQMLDVEAMTDHHWHPTKNDYEIKVQWCGYEPIEDSWEPFRNLMGDVPTLLSKYVEESNDNKLKLHFKAKF